MPFKLFLFGPDGAGKTCTALLLAEALAAKRGGRIAFLDTEYNAKIYKHRNALRKCHPEPFDYDLLETRSIVEANNGVQSIKPTENPVVIIDSFTHLDKACLEAWEAGNPGRVRPKTFEWGTVRKPLGKLLRWIKTTKCDVLCLARQKDEWTGDGDDAKKTGVTYDAWAPTPYEFNVRARMSLGKGADGSPAHVMEVLKDHWSIMSGQKIINPNASILDPYWPFLGSEAGNVQDDEERALDDTVAFQDDENKRKSLEEKSQIHYDTFTARIGAASTVDQMTAIAEEIKKVTTGRNKSLGDAHHASLKIQFTSKLDQLKPKV